jgi:hypothetical protein
MNRFALVLLVLFVAAPAAAQDAQPGAPDVVAPDTPTEAPASGQTPEPTPDPEAKPTPAPDSSADTAPADGAHKKCPKCKDGKKCEHCAAAQAKKCPKCKDGKKCEHCEAAQAKKCPKCKDGKKCERCAAHAEGKPKCKDGKCDKPDCKDGKCKKPKCHKSKCDKPDCKDGKCKKPKCHKSKCDKPDCKDGKCKKPKCHKSKCDKPKCDKEGTQWSWQASLRPRGDFYVNRNFGLTPDKLNYVRPDDVDFISQQTRLGVKATRGALTGKLQLQHVAAWGVFGGDALTDGPIGVHQAWFEIAASESVKVRVGRQELAYGAHRVLGNVGWHQVGRAWDGARVVLTLPADTTLDIIGAQYAEGWVEKPATYSGKPFDEDAYLGGLYVSSKAGGDALKVVDAYLLYDARFESPEAGKDDGTQLRRGLLTTGLRVRGEWDPVDLEIEGAFQTGSGCAPDADGACTEDDVDQAGFFADAEVGFTLMKRLRLFVGGGQASGDDPDTDKNEAYNHLYPTAHKFLGYMDLIGGRTNIREIRGGAVYGFSDKRGKLALTVHDFTRLQPESERVGLEVDVVAGWKFYKGFSGLIGWALFLPDEGITSTDEDPVGNAQWVFVQGVAKF